ncbi:formyltransferase family protein [Thiocapsa rosea]|uniref:formyltransferase family protein n=1 Tax=Thiocapsa rosea TaxID=69360 RepID=UPI000EAF3AC2|nr:formyltransferase family protein [Thiocapsa rosea]
MRISLLCSDAAHPVNAHLERWMRENAARHEIELARCKANLQGGDILFLISCSEIIRASDRGAYRACLVLHASDLPRGRGWSPHIWEITQGADIITLTLLEAADRVDSGRIWHKVRIPIPKDALWDEINEALFNAEIGLISYAVDNFAHVDPQPQDTTIESTYYRRRTPNDSRIDPMISVAEQFDCIRVCDPNRFPAFFDLNGHRYKLILEKLDE